MSMSEGQASPTGLTVVDHVAGGEATLALNSRMMLAANTTLQLTFLFAFLYLRANNFGGMWHPSGVSAPPEVLALVALLVPVVTLLASMLTSTDEFSGFSAMVISPE